MLKIIVPETEIYDEEKNEFLYVKETVLCLEHSLVSISKWESKWKKPFLSPDPKTSEQIFDYIKCMTITQNVNELLYYAISDADITKVNEYIADPMSATTIHNNSESHPGSINGEKTITAEIIYYWMITLNIPVEFQKWHLNKLLKLIEVCSIKNNPDKKKMSRDEILARNRVLNAQRKARLHTRG